MKLVQQTGFRMKKQFAMALGLALMTTAPALAQQTTKATDRPVRSYVQTEEEEARQHPKPADAHGITVHGHWIMDIHDKDGKLVEHRDFYNSLQEVGAATLLRLVAGTAVAERFALSLGVAQGSQYSIVRAGSAEASTLCTSFIVCTTGVTQTLSGINQNSNPTTLVIAGQLTADRDVTINHVSTVLGTCHNTQLDSSTTSNNQDPIATSPATCSAGTYASPIGLGGGQFTGTTITPLSLQQGQVLSVSVTISFS